MFNILNENKKIYHTPTEYSTIQDHKETNLLVYTLSKGSCIPLHCKIDYQNLFSYQNALMYFPLWLKMLQFFMSFFYSVCQIIFCCLCFRPADGTKYVQNLLSAISRFSTCLTQVSLYHETGKYINTKCSFKQSLTMLVYIYIYKVYKVYTIVLCTPS